MNLAPNSKCRWILPGRSAHCVTCSAKRADDEVVAELVLHHPEHREVVRRVQLSSTYPYAEIQDNLIGADCLPIDMLRCKLSFFGATRFDPKSELWTRITMYQGAPLFDELQDRIADDWWLPVLGGWLMQCSDNELEMTLRKAVLGVGYKFGTAVDVATGRRVAQPSRVSTESKQSWSPCSPTLLAVRLERVNGDVVISAARAIAAGPAAIDLAIASDAASRVRLVDVDSPNLVLGLAGVAAGDFSQRFTFDCDGSSLEIDCNTTSLQAVPSDCLRMTLAVGGTEVQPG